MRVPFHGQLVSIMPFQKTRCKTYICILFYCYFENLKTKLFIHIGDYLWQILSCNGITFYGYTISMFKVRKCCKKPLCFFFKKRQ